MSVLIKGMQLPDMCGHCRFATAFECEVTKNFITTFNVRQSDCPLVPVPPHGDLIERNALFKKCEFVCTDDDEDIRAVRYSIIENAPTVIPASEDEIDEAQRDYQAAADYQQYCETYEQTYDPETGAM